MGTHATILAPAQSMGCCQGILCCDYTSCPPRAGRRATKACGRRRCGRWLGPTVAKRLGATSGRDGWHCTCAREEGDDAQPEVRKLSRSLAVPTLVSAETDCT